MIKQICVFDNYQTRPASALIAVTFTCDVILHYVTLMTSEQELSDSSSASSPDSRCWSDLVVTLTVTWLRISVIGGNEDAVRGEDAECGDDAECLEIGLDTNK